MNADARPMVSERLRALRERINRREQQTRADRRAKQRRIEREEPEGATERAQVKVRQVSQQAEQSADEARQLSSSAKKLIATELGVSTSEAESVIQQGADLLDSAGESVDSLDFDGDGDTDILSVIEPPGEDDAGGGSGGQSSVEAVGGGSIEAVGDDSGMEPIYDPYEDDGL